GVPRARTGGRRRAESGPEGAASALSGSCAPSVEEGSSQRSSRMGPSDVCASTRPVAAGPCSAHATTSARFGKPHSTYHPFLSVRAVSVGALTATPPRAKRRFDHCTSTSAESRGAPEPAACTIPTITASSSRARAPQYACVSVRAEAVASWRRNDGFTGISTRRAGSVTPSESRWGCWMPPSRRRGEREMSSRPAASVPATKFPEPGSSTRAKWTLAAAKGACVRLSRTEPLTRPARVGVCASNGFTASASTSAAPRGDSKSNAPDNIVELVSKRVRWQINFRNPQRSTVFRKCTNTIEPAVMPLATSSSMLSPVEGHDHGDETFATAQCLWSDRDVANGAVDGHSCEAVHDDVAHGGRADGDCHARPGAGPAGTPRGRGDAPAARGRPGFGARRRRRHGPVGPLVRRRHRDRARLRQRSASPAHPADRVRPGHHESRHRSTRIKHDGGYHRAGAPY